MQIDSHHHLWRYNAQEYPWISDDMEVLRRDYLPEQLKTNLEWTGIEGTVAVQARQTVEETRWLLELAGQHPFIRGVVGWVPLCDEQLPEVLEPLAANPRLRGVRHVVQDEPDDDFILREDFNRGISRLKEVGLVYDILIFAQHLPQTIKFVDQHPDQPFVLDHIAKPTICAEAFDQFWAEHIQDLAKRPNVTCKLSGIVTEVRDPEWTVELIEPYYETVLEAFGPQRLMFGTDWPVCRLRCEYQHWVETVRELISDLSDDEQAQIMGGTAARVYGLK